MVKLYVADISLLTEPKKHMRQRIGAGLLLEKVLALCFDGKKPDEFVRSRGVHGKPMIEGVEYNLSHSGDWVICAISDKPVGCDIEKIRKAPATVANHFFSDKEKEYLDGLSPEQYDEGFFRIWTLKESYVKMTGEGLAVPFGSYEILMDGQAKVLRNGQIQECCMSELAWNGYRIAVCAKEEVEGTFLLPCP